MNRRTFLLCGTISVALATPIVAQAQKAGKVSHIGMLWSFSFPSPATRPLLDAFRHGLAELGYAEGQNLIFEHRSAEGRTEHLRDRAAELVELKVDLLLAPTTAAAQAAKQATTTIPIVAVTMADPIADGLVASLARPGGNITGLTFLGPELVAKRLELFREAVPRISQVAALWQPGVYGERTMREMMNAAEATATQLGLRLQLQEARSIDDLDTAFAAIARGPATALIVLPSPLFFTQRRRIVGLATQYRLPTMYPYREAAEDGGLIAYGASVPDLFRRGATYVDKLLKGAKPGDLPIEQPTKFDFVINLKTARALGLTIPPALLLRADQVIE